MTRWGGTLARRTALSLAQVPASAADTAARVLFLSKSITTADLSAAAVTQTISFDAGVAAQSHILGTSIALITPFSGGGAAACAVDVGDPSDTDAFVAGSDVFAAAVGGSASTLPVGIAPNKRLGAVTPSLTVTSDVNVDQLTAGSMIVYLKYAVQP